MRPQTDRHTDSGEHYTFRAVYTTHAKCNKYTDIFKKQISVIFHHLYLLKQFLHQLYISVKNFLPTRQSSWLFRQPFFVYL